MNRLLGFLGLSLGSWLGWSLGMQLSLTTAIFLSIVGTGLGLYAGHWIARNFF